MRRKFFAVFFLIELFFCPNFVFLQNASEISQTLVPLEVYVGDVAEIRYSFKLDLNFPFEENFEKEIDVEKIPFENISD